MSTVFCHLTTRSRAVYRIAFTAPYLSGDRRAETIGRDECKARASGTGASGCAGASSQLLDGELQVLDRSEQGDRRPQGLKFERLADEGINAAQGAGGRLKFFRKGCDHHDGLLG